jgi:hypothetical protein
MNIPSEIRAVSLVEYGSMCKDVYRDQAEENLYHILSDCGWERVTGGEWIIGDFYARLYGRKRDGRTVLAYRGTQTKMNWVHNAKLLPLNDIMNSSYPKFAEETYKTAITIAKKKNYLPPMAVTGHSLGGCLAQATAIAINHDKKNEVLKGKIQLHAIAFNPLHISEVVIKKNWESIPVGLKHDYILNYNIDNDWIHKLGSYKNGLHHEMQGNPACSIESIQELARPKDFLDFLDPTGIKATERAAKTLGRLGNCVLDEHYMDAVLERLWTMQKDPHGDHCLPVKPADISYHSESEFHTTSKTPYEQAETLQKNVKHSMTNKILSEIGP